MTCLSKPARNHCDETAGSKDSGTPREKIPRKVVQNVLSSRGQSCFLRKCSSSTLFEVLTSRLLNLVVSGETKEFHKFYRFACLSLGTKSFRSEIYVDRAYSYLSSYLSILGHQDVFVQEEIVRYLSRTLTGIWNCVSGFAKLFKLPCPLLGDIQCLLWSGEALPAIKYATCWYWNYFLGSRRRDFPSNNRGYSTKMFGWKEELMRRKRDKELHYSLFMGLKKGLPPLCPVVLRENLAKHRVSLTRTPSLSEERSNRISRYCDEVLRMTKPQFGDKVYCSTSTGASYECPRVKGGQANAMMSILRKEFPEQYLLGTPVLLGFQITEEHYLLGRAHEKNGPNDRWNRSGSYTTIQGRYDCWFDEDDIFEDFSLMMRVNVDSVAKTTPHGVLEPMKVRIITKGDVFAGNFLSPVKDVLQAALRPIACFSPVFKPVSDQDVQKLDTRDDEWWCSGDFSAATDDANMLISQAICEEILEGSHTPEIYRAMALRSLCSNKIKFNENALGLRGIFPKIFDRENGQGRDPAPFEEKYEQTNGQLMGSIISFPILCLMNLFSYWEARESFLGFSIPLTGLLSMFPVLIHGDDILFKCSPEFYDHWAGITKEYGFNLSLGKNLYLEHSCTIDSIYFTTERGVIERHGYVNMGLITGCRKGDQTEGTVDRTYGNPEDWNFWERCAALKSEFDKNSNKKEHCYALWAKFAKPHLVDESLDPSLNTTDERWYIPDMYNSSETPEYKKQSGGYFANEQAMIRFLDYLPCMTIPTATLAGGFGHFYINPERENVPKFSRFRQFLHDNIVNIYRAAGNDVSDIGRFSYKKSVDLPKVEIRAPLF